MLINKQTNKHSYIQTYIYAHIHTHIHTHTHTNTHTYKRTNTQTYIHIHDHCQVKSGGGEIGAHIAVLSVRCPALVGLCTLGGAAGGQWTQGIVCNTADLRRLQYDSVAHLLWWVYTDTIREQGSGQGQGDGVGGLGGAGGALPGAARARVRMGEFSTLVALELMSLAPGLGLPRLAEECRARAAGTLGV